MSGELLPEQTLSASTVACEAGSEPFASCAAILGMNQGLGRPQAILDIRHFDRHSRSATRSIEQVPEGSEPGRT